MHCCFYPIVFFLPNTHIADLSSFKKYYAGSRAEDIQVGTKCANVTKCQRCEFFAGD